MAVPVLKYRALITMIKMARSFFLFFLPVLIFGAGVSWATFYGTPKTGLQNFGRDPYAYSVFVPENYTSEHSWPLVVALRPSGKAGDEALQSWISGAQRRGYIVLCLSVPALISTSQTGTDTRILKVKAEVQSQYEIDRKRIWLTGTGDAGHYALYLGLKHPHEFSAIACVGNVLRGPLSKLFSFSMTETRRRMPLLVVTGPEGEAEAPAAVDDLDLFQKQGYPVEVVQSDSLQNLTDAAVQPLLMDWFETAGRIEPEQAGSAVSELKVSKLVDKALH